MANALTFSSSSSRILLVESAAADLRLASARRFVGRHAPRGDVLIIGASRGAADDFARTVAAHGGATIGLHRFSLTQLAARIAAPILAADGVAPSSPLGREAVAARAAFDARTDGALRYFAPVASTPGFSRALARTLGELRLAGIGAEPLRALPLGGADLAELLERFEDQFRAASATDRAALFASATRALETAPDMYARAALVLLDVAPDSPAEFAFVRALVGSEGGHEGRPVLITIPFGDVPTLEKMKTLGVDVEVLQDSAETDLAMLRRHLFADSQPRQREPAGDVVLFSAPGEGRECVEIARRVLAEARAGIAFDEMAVFLRAPDRYVGLLEHAFSRAGIPAYFDRGTRRPHPAGRAFLALIACACEKLSARRFAEYLSLAQVPALTDAPRTFEFFVPDDEELAFPRRADEEDDARDDDASPEPAVASEDDAVVHGSLRAPWKWETLIVESAVIGGDPTRWHRRLDGLANDFQLRLAAERRDDPESPQAARLERDLRNLNHLRSFALPVIDRLAGWPVAATWGEWLDRFADLAPSVLRHPERVLRVIEQLRPMSSIGPVTLDEARTVLAERLLALEYDPPKHRYGHVFVASAHQARGRTFRIVFVAGLAERMFPQRPHEDPMLPDGAMRARLDAPLPLQPDRARAERLLLRLAVGAARERVWLSYPRMDVSESRPRVPSFYVLDVMRAITGRIPRHETLREQAAARGGASLAWPAPTLASDAIDDLEHDLSVLKQLMDLEPRSPVRGQAHYLLRLNEALRRSVTARWARGRSVWSQWDGITRVTGMTRPTLDAQRLTARPYSLSALQKFAACPYQFLLSAIYRLHPPDEIEPLQKLNPLMRGSIFHEAQAELFRELKRAGRLPLRPSDLAAALDTLDRVLVRIAAEYAEKLAPAIDRVWRDEIQDISRDLHVWVRRLAEEDGWVPEYFEYAFGLPHDTGRDPASRAEPVLVADRFLLRGSVDLIERRSDGAARRVTDHKTGRNRTTWKTVIGGGAILQPVLYSLAVEQALGVPIGSGRLSYCTSAGGFVDHEIPINDANRRSGIEALEIIDRAVELGCLPAAPTDRACTWCDFRPVCGPNQPERIRRKSPEKLGDLEALRERP
jgi:CRISPR/Cas system-associated exonuclease Cas4 (RecB family)